MRTVLVLLVVACGAAHAEDPEAKRLADLASSAHKHAQQTKDPKDYETAASLYEQYFAKPAHPEEHAMSFFYAELLFRLQRYDDAAKYYDRAVIVDPKGRFAKEAAYAAMISMRNATDTPEHKSDKPPCPDSKPCPIPQDLQRLLAAFDRYLKIVPDSPERANVEYRRARIYYEHNHFAEAAPQFDHILVAYPGHELATYSANLELDCRQRTRCRTRFCAWRDRCRRSASTARRRCRPGS